MYARMLVAPYHLFPNFDTPVGTLEHDIVFSLLEREIRYCGARYNNFEYV